MKNRNTIILFKILNVWFGFITLMFISSQMPHLDFISYHLWISVSLYFLAFLFSYSIFKKEKQNKDLFFNLSLYLLFNALSFLPTFFGSNLIGNEYTTYYIYQYRKILFCFFLNFFIVHATIKYISPTLKKGLQYILSTGIVLSVIVLNFYPYIIDPEYIFSLESTYIQDMYKRVFLTNGLSIIFLLTYGYHLFKKDIQIGTHVNSLMAFFFVVSIKEAVDNLAKIFTFQIYGIGQYFLMLNLIFLSYILFKKLVFISSDYGQFYESLITRKVDLGNLKIQKQGVVSNELLFRIIKIYFAKRKNYILALGVLTASAFSYFRFPAFFTINMVALLICILILFFFFGALLKRRLKNKYL